MEDKKKEFNALNQGLIERLRVAMDRVHTNARELAERADVGRSFVYDVLSGKSLNPTTHKLSAVADALGVSLSYLLYGEESWGGRSNPELVTEQPEREQVAIASIGVEASMGGGTIVTEEKEDEPFFFRRSWVRQKLNASPGDLRIIRVRGDSMLPTLSEGDVVLVNMMQKNPSPPGIFVLFDGFGLVVKRLEVQSEGQVRIYSDNTQYAPYTRSLSEVNIIGRVVWFAREL